MKKILVVLTLFMMFSIQAQALIEARLSYGFLGSKPDLSQVYSGPSSIPVVAPVYGVGADILFNFPLSSWGVGLRYENLNLKVSNSTLDISIATSRSALVVNYRIINTLVFLGPIATYGLTHSGTVKVKENGTEISNISAGSYSSYSIGLEGGISLVGLLLGAEIGNESFVFNNTSDSGSAGRPPGSLNMSGLYGKVMVGFGI